ncbi:DUF4435 domain-containing protein [Vibrio vulnificus]|uniref:DUF4435 domain-containing protein n=1 Tax=Vibrio vulnificus TaxID=672 RepID=UPI0028DE4C66|nr:DUF4435 domain-containing protein [Vibrio vulnificus]MDT8806336.1 DUF4435 domain-containing protein [Vibrio vulnificus]MDT8826862.1 DUF4435 domain-containing protein [Vibrio vulnificus]
MDDFFYSDDALNVIHEFHEAEKVVYVEGDDDVVFWEIIFSKFTTKSYYFKSVDGCENLEPYKTKIINGIIDDIVASDIDFIYFDEENEVPSHSNLLWTYGHSIENTILSKGVIPSIIASLARVSRRLIDPVHLNEWYDNFVDKFMLLIKYDLVSEVQKVGISVLGDNCTRFMIGPHSPSPCCTKIQNFIDSNNLESSIFVDNDLIDAKLSSRSRLLSDFIRGHFLFSACLKYVNSYVKRIGKNKSLSVDAFFSGSMLAFSSGFDGTHEHYNFYQQQVLALENL